MKKVLITGKGSYIGRAFMKYARDFDMEIDELSVHGNNWRDVDFSEYDSIFHVAGIAHVPSSKTNIADLYLKVNRDLAIEVAEKAKRDGVNQFIFMSSMIVYGEQKVLNEIEIIKRETPFSPIDVYGQSKAEADKAISKLTDKTFKTVIIRTPMVYGPNAKGNFPRLISIAKKSLFFPRINNQRSMIYIDNLADFVMKSIKYNLQGIYFPQNKKYVNTSDILRITRKLDNKPIIFVGIFNIFINLAARRIRAINKIYGSKIYEWDDKIPFDYQVVKFEDSIEKVVRGTKI